MVWTEGVLLEEAKKEEEDKIARKRAEELSDEEVFEIEEIEIIKLHVKVIKEPDGRFTFYSPDLDISSCGNSELEGWNNFIAALEEAKEFLNVHREEMSEELRRKFEILEYPIMFEFIQ